MFCTRCGAQIPEGSRFCTVCGQPVDAAEPATGFPDQPVPGTPMNAPMGVSANAPVDDGAQEAMDQLWPQDQGAATSYQPASQVPPAWQPDQPAVAEQPIQSTTATPLPAASHPNPAAPAAFESSRPRRKGLPTPAIVAIAFLVALAIAGTIAAVWWNVDQGSKAQAADEARHKEVAVEFTVDAAGLDTSTGSKIPLSVSGTDLDGKAVDKVFYIGANGKGLKLREGSYTGAVKASPIAKDGTLYQAQPDSIKIVVKEGGKAEVSGADGWDGKKSTWKFTAIDPLSVTDEQIAAAYESAKDGGSASADAAGKLKEAAEQKRAAAQEQKRADDEAAAAKQKAEEDAKKQQEAEAASTVTASAYTFKLPASWRGRVTTQVSGNQITVSSTQFPKHPVCVVDLVPDFPAGDPSSFTFAIGKVGANYITVHMQNYGNNIPYYAEQNSTDPDLYYSLDEARELVYLQTGGAISYDDCASTYDSSTHMSEAASGVYDAASTLLTGAATAR